LHARHHDDVIKIPDLVMLAVSFQHLSLATGHGRDKRTLATGTWAVVMSHPVSIPGLALSGTPLRGTIDARDALLCFDAALGK
jgi:hypothetical protein